MLIIHCKLIAGYFFVVYYLSRPFVWTTRDLTKRVHIVPSRHSFGPRLIELIFYTNTMQHHCLTPTSSALPVPRARVLVHSRSGDKAQWKYDTDRWDLRSVMMLDAFTSVHIILKYLPPGCGEVLDDFYETQNALSRWTYTKCYFICTYIYLFIS